MRLVRLLSSFVLLISLASVQAQDISSEFTKTYRAYNNAFAQGNYPRAAELAEKAVVLANNELGPDHEKTAIMRINLGHVLVIIGETERAEPIINRAKAAFEKIHGKQHPSLVTVHEDLAKIYANKKEIDKSRQSLGRAIAIIKKHKGEKDPEIANFLIQQGTLDIAKNNIEAAEKVFTEALEIYKSKYGERSISAANVISLMGDVELLKKNLEPAEAHYQNALSIYEENLVEDDPIVLNAHSRMAKMYIALRDKRFTDHADKVIKLMQDKEGAALPMFVMQPQYPVFEDGRKPQGWVLLEFTVKADGKVENLKILESLPAGLFDKVTLDAAATWRFKPRYVDGKRIKQSKSRARLVFRKENIEVHFGEMGKGKS